ncbi:MAG: lytic transglycosylase domain-containing protein [Acidobacteria bacterium]|nr:lytic transglycosylase domain-containing protein [Acidobacteriota bacterium]
MKPVFFAILLCVPSLAGEYAVLQSGFRIKVERHEQVGTNVRLFTGGDSVIEMPAASIATFEADEYVPPPPPPAPVPVQAEPVAEPKPALTPQELVDQAAKKHGIPAEFVHLVARAESAYRNDAISPKGAIGIMQLMPATAASLNADPHDPEQNVEAGTRLLRELLAQYENHPDQLRRALAAYNAGPGAVQKYNGVPPYRETQAYVNKIVEAYRRKVAATPAK